MPAIVNARHTAPTLTINEVKGWQTRLLYSYYGKLDTLMDYVEETEGAFNRNLFTVIDEYENTSEFTLKKGVYTFPPSYFWTGKSVKIEGQFLVSVEEGPKNFNIRANIKKQNGDIAEIAATNNYNSHTFARGNSAINVPVYFKIVYTSVVNTETSVYMMANGHYQYEFSSYDGAESTNQAVVYVPIWYINKDTPSVYTEIAKESNELRIEFTNSTVSSIKPVYITIEELQ